MARTSAEDPLKVFRFIVEFGGARTGFMEVSGLKRNTEIAEYREGGNNETPQKSAGLTKFENVTLKRGQILDAGQNDLYNWAQQVMDVATVGGGLRDYRRDIDIVQYDRGGVVGARWRCYECWPTEFKPTGDLNATSNDNSIEELVLAIEGFEKVA